MRDNISSVIGVVATGGCVVDAIETVSTNVVISNSP